MRVTFLCRSDLRGGAAIVTYRLMQSMRESGIDARMLVCEKLSDSPYVDYCAPKWKIQYSFLKERLNVYYHNGFNRSTLFKIDPSTDGLLYGTILGFAKRMPSISHGSIKGW